MHVGIIVRVLIWILMLEATSASAWKDFVAILTSLKDAKVLPTLISSCFILFLKLNKYTFLYILHQIMHVVSLYLNLLQLFKKSFLCVPFWADVDDCADNATNPCVSNASCNNTQGSPNCLCPKGYYGDGRKDGIGCIHLPHSMSKHIIILTGKIVF